MEKETVKLTKLSKCAGCGAKVGAGVLAQLLKDIKVHSDPNLLVGFDHSDDASVYRISDNLALVQTVDFFPPIADDPYLFGQIAATNALSDVYAMGGEPKLCLNIMAVPEKMPMEAVHEILRGGYDKVYEAGALITGGHSIHDDEPKYGLAVTGFVHPDRVLTNSGAKPGDVLFLTKPLGIGILSTAAKVDMVSEQEQKHIYELMTTLNRAARDVMVKYDVHACTDVTGFGLMGHAFEMMEGSDTQAVIDTSALDLIPEAKELAKYGLIPAGAYRNRTFAEKAVKLDGIEGVVNVNDAAAERTMIEQIGIGNDANAAALGEFLAGSAKGSKNAIAITLGTGVGGGIIIDGKIYSGSNYAGAELGHMVIVKDGRECGCGRKGCWEAYASATALINMTKEAIRNEKAEFSYMLHLADDDIDNVNGKTAFDAQQAGDNTGAEVIDQYIGYLATGLINVINIFQPDVLCIGGGIANQGENLLGPLRTIIEQERFTKYNEKQTKVCIASLGNDAGIIGAARL